jgi:hypothetical protein
VPRADLETCIRVLARIREKAEAAESASKAASNVLKMNRAA